MGDFASESELRQRAERHHHRPLTPEEYEALLSFRADWATIAADADARFFVLGSFAAGDVNRVNELKRFVNEEARDGAIAYRMDDFVTDDDVILHPILKFKLIADGSHHVVGVCEHDQGGQLIEHGLLVESRSYIDKTHVLKRSYPEGTEKERYSWMQTFGVFEIFDHYGRLHEWTDGEYRETVESVVDDLT